MGVENTPKRKGKKIPAAESEVHDGKTQPHDRFTKPSRASVLVMIAVRTAVYVQQQTPTAKVQPVMDGVSVMARSAFTVEECAQILHLAGGPDAFTTDGKISGVIGSGNVRRVKVRRVVALSPEWKWVTERLHALIAEAADSMWKSRPIAVTELAEMESLQLSLYDAHS